ncbi:sugar phosphate isomerase/epimerase family protein [Arthrobacter sp. TS-15]|uniref:sugar phosphate isomerase/epimerase family protein n=1 Tax=Arthrobacter sp. TS-15 TaxID=2510797 RepID=UPI001EE84884|nr:sugar phosphate isomerase/epimerase [Arthrobacter sp. TS-15]
MSGLPAAEAGGTTPAWNVNPWHSAYLDSLEYQWDEVAVPFWRDIEALAAEHEVKVCIEMHPHNLVFNPATLKRLVERVGATHIGAEMDPSHLFWQGIDPVAAIKDLGPLVFHAAAKDTRINDRCKVNGVLDDRFTRVTDNPLELGGHWTLNTWPTESSWDFVAVGRGHDETFWRGFLDTLRKVDSHMAVNIEHEDMELTQLEGLGVVARTLQAANSQLGRSGRGYQLHWLVGVLQVDARPYEGYRPHHRPRSRRTTSAGAAREATRSPTAARSQEPVRAAIQGARSDPGRPTDGRTRERSGQAPWDMDVSGCRAECRSPGGRTGKRHPRGGGWRPPGRCSRPSRPAA